MSNNCPVILVHGIFGWGQDEVLGLNYFGTARAANSPLEVLQSNVAPISSNHDRACQLAAQIKGTKVDYGQTHADEFGHEQHDNDMDKNYQGKALYEGWSESNPVHLVGHSMGCPTSRMLQHLLAIDYFGWGSNEKWIKSISGIAGVNNGTTLVHMFGADEETALLNENTAADFLMGFIEFYAFAGRYLFERVYDLDLKYWGLEQQNDESFKDYLVRIASNPFMLGKDNAAYDLSVKHMYNMNKSVKTYPNTYYFSYVTEQTFEALWSGWQRPELLMNPALLASATWMGRKTFSNPEQLYPDFKATDWWKNDGSVSSFSQFYPRISGQHNHEPMGNKTSFEKGVWYSKELSSWDHLDIVMTPELWKIGQQKRFYSELFNRLASLQ